MSKEKLPQEQERAIKSCVATGDNVLLEIGV